MKHKLYICEPSEYGDGGVDLVIARTPGEARYIAMNACEACVDHSFTEIRVRLAKENTGTFVYNDHLWFEFLGKGPIELEIGSGIVGDWEDFLRGDLPSDRWKVVASNVSIFEQTCRICGCTQNHACEGGCYWVEDDLCSSCAVTYPGVYNHE